MAITRPIESLIDNFFTIETSIEILEKDIEKNKIQLRELLERISDTIVPKDATPNEVFVIRHFEKNICITRAPNGEYIMRTRK